MTGPDGPSLRIACAAFEEDAQGSLLLAQAPLRRHEFRGVDTETCYADGGRRPRPAGVILIRWTGSGGLRHPISGGMRITVAVVFTPEVKRQLATLEATTQRALDVGRQIVERTLTHPPDLSTLRCAVEVTGDELQPSGPPDLTTADGTRVWLVHADA